MTDVAGVIVAIAEGVSFRRKKVNRAALVSGALFIAMALCGCSAAAASNISWASSPNAFLERWNSNASEAYRISGFHMDSLGKPTGDLPGASIYALDSMYSLSTRDPQMFEAMCTHTVQAALGVSLEDAHGAVVAAQAESRSAAVGDFGMVVYHGYQVSVASAAAGQEFVCTIRPENRD